MNKYEFGRLLRLAEKALEAAATIVAEQAADPLDKIKIEHAKELVYELLKKHALTSPPDGEKK